MTFPATNLNEAVQLIVPDSNAFHSIINGDADQTVITPEGREVPSALKAMADSLLFKNPIPWEEGALEQDPLQLRTFTDGLIYWAPTAQVTNPVAMGASPVDDSNWKISPIIKSHNSLTNRDESGAHPASAITGVREMRDELVGGVIFPFEPEEELSTGDVVPEGVTHLRVGGAIYAMSPIATGSVTAITSTSSTIGGVSVYFKSVSGSATYDLVRLNGALSDSALIETAISYLESRGGGEIRYGFSPVITEPITLVSNVYHNLCGHTVTQADGANVDIFKTKDFDLLKGVGPLFSSPHNFGVYNGVVDGNYLDDFEASSIGVDTTVNNTNGYGFKIFGSQYRVEVILNNCPKVGFYSEVVDYTGYGKEQACIIDLRGRVFGQEAIVYRGPADVEIRHAFMGCAGWLATKEQRRSTLVMSELFPSMPVHVMVSDEAFINGVDGERYHGHHEFGTLHLYGNLNGYGYYSNDAGRLKGNHLIAENCRGGFRASPRTWGNISILECHNNGRKPDNYTGSLGTLPDICNISQQGFTIDATVRRVKVESEIYLAYTDEENGVVGRNGIQNVNYFSLNDPLTLTPPVGNVADIKGDGQFFTLNCRDVNGDAVNHQGSSNKINVIARSVTGNVINRVAGATSGNRGNEFEIVANDVGNCFRLDGLVASETVKITANLKSGQTVTNGDTPELVTRVGNWIVSATIGSNIKASKRRGRVNLDNTNTNPQTVTVEHGFFTTPDPALVQHSLFDPSPVYQGSIEYCYLQSVSATSLVFAYKLLSTGSGGPLVLNWSVD